jgi:RNA polymerase sigma factor (sigma-70 family)
MINDDMELVRQYAAHRSESAFAELVSRHTNLVYSTALRRVSNPQLAEEIAQAVFVILARKAATLGNGTILSGWLYRATCYVSGHALKQELRRQRHQQEAHMETLSKQTESEVWPQIRTLLEEAMLRLGPADRDALVLRFFEGRSLKEVGARLGISEAATKMRLNRALEKLRAYFSKHGVASTTTAIAGAISAHSIQPAPVMLAKMATAFALANRAATSTSTSTLIKGTLKIMAWSKMKTATVSAVILVMATTTTMIVRRETKPSSPHPVLLDKTSFVYGGYRTPDKTMQTMLWAMIEGDSDAYLACCTSEEQARREKAWAGKSKEELSAKGKKELAAVTGVTILEQTNISANEMVLTARLEGTGNTEKMRFTKIGDEWKFAQELH